MQHTITKTLVFTTLLVGASAATAYSGFSDLIRSKAKETVSEVIAKQAARATDRVLDKAVTQVVDGTDQSEESDPSAESTQTSAADNDYAELDDADSVE